MQEEKLFIREVGTFRASIRASARIQDGGKRTENHEVAFVMTTASPENAFIIITHPSSHSNNGVIM